MMNTLQATAPAQPPAPQTFTSAVEVAHSDSVELLQRIARLAERLVGPEPEGKTEQNVPVPAGILPTVYFTARQITECAVRSHELLSRIESSLP